MNFLVTSLLYSNFEFATHVGNYNLSVFKVWHEYGYEFITYGPNSEVRIPVRSKANAMCATSNLDVSIDDIPARLNLLKDYAERKNDRSYWPKSFMDRSCILHDTVKNHMWLISDAVGYNPIWYALNEDEDRRRFLVTSDLLAAYTYDMTFVTPTGPGQLIGIDLNTYEIFAISQWHTDVALHDPNTKSILDPTIYSRSLYLEGLKLIYNMNNTFDSSIVTVELDEAEHSSLLLHCLMDSLHVTRAIRTTPLLVSDNIPNRQLYNDILNETLLQKHQLYYGNTKTVPLIRTAAEKWRLCDLAAVSRTRTLISFDSGINARPEEVFFQNYFCTILNVTVLYPFLNERFQRMLWNTNHPSSYFTQAYGILRNANLCEATRSTGIRSFHHAKTIKQVDNEGRSIERSVNCVQNDHLCHNSIKFFDNKHDFYHYNSSKIVLPCDFIIDEQNNHQSTNNCKGEQTYSYSKYTNREIYSLRDLHIIHGERHPLGDLYVTAHEHANKDGYIVLLLVTSGYLDLLVNFIHYAHAKHIQFNHFLIITLEQEVIDLCKLYNIGYIVPTGQHSIDNTLEHHSYDDYNLTEPHDELKNPLLFYDRIERYLLEGQSHDFGTFVYQQLILYRTKCAMELLFMGFNPIIADIDTIWLQNPLDIITHSISDPRKMEILTTNSLQPSKGKYFDIAFTDDNSEVCGCFVVLRNTTSTIDFWKVVTARHQFLITNATKHNNNNFVAFTDSEQKILTDLIYGHQYVARSNKLKLKVKLLSMDAFPSGMRYFNQRSFQNTTSTLPDDVCDILTSASSSSSSTTTSAADVGLSGKTTITSPSKVALLLKQNQKIKKDKCAQQLQLLPNQTYVVHNNFLIGVDMKITRFQRYGNWPLLPYFTKSFHSILDHNDIIANDYYNNRGNANNHKHNNNGYYTIEQETPFDPLYFYKYMFHNVYKNITIPTLSINLPIHNTIYKVNDIIVQVGKEDVKDDDKLIVYLETDPLTWLDFYGSSVFEMTASSNDSITSVTVMIRDTNIAVSVDIGLNRSNFGTDYNHKYAHQANRAVLHHANNLITTTTYDLLGNSLKSSKNYRTLHETSNTESLITMNYTIKVLAYKRKNSLLRLLNSLRAAEYLGHKISMEIFVDGNKTEEEYDVIQEVIEAAESFTWPYGRKLVTKRATNIGLAQSWYYSFVPVKDTEAAFVFEDDIEVSPYYFVYSKRAVDKYYANDPFQREAHWNLARTMREHVTNNGSTNGITAEVNGVTMEFENILDYWAYLNAGKPLIYGICLQKQHLDARHFPIKVEVRNGYQPFLYSLMGSWGPLLLPLTWHAFRDWWKWATIQQLSPVTENIITNSFYNANRGIWTPWHIKFATLTGAKCLYSNLPDNYSLVVNHREAGENYGETLGANTELLTFHHYTHHKLVNIPFLLNISGFTERGRFHDFISDYRRSDYKQMLNNYALTSYPNFEQLALHQYDLNLRRIGSCNSDNIYIADDFITRKYSKELICTHKKFSWHSRSSHEAVGNNNMNANNLDPNTDESCLCFHSLYRHIRWYEDHMRVYLGDELQITDMKLSLVHWSYIIEMVKMNLPPQSHILHMETTPIVIAYAQQNDFINSLITVNEMICTPLHFQAPTSSAQFQSRQPFLLKQQYRSDNITQSVITCRSYHTLTPGTDEMFDMVILNTGLLAALKYDVPWTFSKIVQPIQYILVLDRCSAAPTEFTIDYGCFTYNGCETIKYSVIEDMCRTGSTDLGAVLYKAIQDEDELMHRYGVSKRLSKTLMTTRFLKKMSTPTFV